MGCAPEQGGRFGDQEGLSLEYILAQGNGNVFKRRWINGIGRHHVADTLSFV